MADHPFYRLRRRLAERGAWSTLRKAWGDHVFRSSESVILECRPEWLQLAAPHAGGALTYVAAGKGDDLPPMDPWLAPRAADFRSMLAAGKRGLFVLRDGKAVGCAWVALADHHDAEARESYPVAPGEAYHYCWLVEPGERRRGTGLALARFALAWLRDAGIRRQFGVVDRANRASYRVLSHFGYRECGMRVRHLYLLHTRWTRQSRYGGTLGLHPAATRGRR